MTSPRDILERLEKAEGPDRELDADIAEMVYPYLAKCTRIEPGLWMSAEDGPVYCEHFTASLDAAIVLARMLAPSAVIDIGVHPDFCQVEIALNRREADFDGMSAGDGPNGPIALLLALFRALGERQ